MPGIYVGTNAIKNVYIGTTPVKSVYVGTTKVRPNGWDMSKWTLAQTSSALSGTWWGGVFFNPSGTKIFLTVSPNHTIYESSLSTPYDLSQITFNKSINSQGGRDNWGPEDIHFSTDGTKMYTVRENASGCAVDQYNLSTAWDISTVSNKTSLQVGTGRPFARGLYITPDGKKIFITIHNSTTYYIVPLSTAWNISTAGTVTTASSNYGGLSIWFGNDGKFFAGQGGEHTTYLDYATVSSAYTFPTSANTKNIGVCRAGGLRFNDEGTICVMVGGGSSTNYVTKYTL